jgi:hypothetical protein
MPEFFCMYGLAASIMAIRIFMLAASLSSLATAFSLAWQWIDKSVPLGKYWRRRRLGFRPHSLKRMAASGKLCCIAAWLSQSRPGCRGELRCACIGPLCPAEQTLTTIRPTSANRPSSRGKHSPFMGPDANLTRQLTYQTGALSLRPRTAAVLILLSWIGAYKFRAQYKKDASA